MKASAAQAGGRPANQRWGIGRASETRRDRGNRADGSHPSGAHSRMGDAIAQAGGNAWGMNSSMLAERNASVLARSMS